MPVPCYAAIRGWYNHIQCGGPSAKRTDHSRWLFGKPPESYSNPYRNHQSVHPASVAQLRLRRYASVSVSEPGLEYEHFRFGGLYVRGRRRHGDQRIRLIRRICYRKRSTNGKKDCEFLSGHFVANLPSTSGFKTKKLTTARPSGLAEKPVDNQYGENSLQVSIPLENFSPSASLACSA